MAILRIKEITLYFSVKIAGQFYIDAFLARRGIPVTIGLTARLDLEAMRRDNPEYRINLSDDDNCVSYTRIYGGNTPGNIVFTVYFDTPVHWPAVN